MLTVNVYYAATVWWKLKEHSRVLKILSVVMLLALRMEQQHMPQPLSLL